MKTPMTRKRETFLAHGGREYESKIPTRGLGAFSSIRLAILRIRLGAARGNQPGWC